MFQTSLLEQDVLQTFLSTLNPIAESLTVLLGMLYNGWDPFKALQQITTRVLHNSNALQRNF